MHALFVVLAVFVTWKLVRYARWRRCGGHGHHHGWHRRGGFFRRRLERVFDVLDTTPDQERVILEAIAEVRGAAREGRSELFDARGDLAELLREPSFEESTLDKAFARHDAFVGKLRVTVAAALAKVHAALDERQRARLAELVAGHLPRSMRGGFAGGVYR